MPKILTAVLAVLLLAGCASTGPQQASDVAFAHKDPKPARLAVNTDAVAADANCYGDGQSGRRVQAVYTWPSGGTDQYATDAATIRTYAARVDGVFNDSAAQTGGTAHVRWACTNGQVDVLDVQVPAGADIGASRSAVSTAVGGLRSDRKYLVWGDQQSKYCGISYVAPNDTPDPATNPANNSSGFGRIDNGCWGGMTEAHELAHGLGAVQLSAPHSNGAWHCTDEYDRMCYNDGSGATLTYVCPSSDEAILDCHHDDYFRAAAPVAGSYLASHWNVADSGFLEVVKSASTPTPTPSPSPSPSPSPTVTPTPTPSPTVTPTPTPTPTVKCPGKSNKPGCRAKRTAAGWYQLTSFWHAGRAFRLLRF